MTVHDEGDDEIQLTRLLQAVRADADPALWTRVRARIEARRRLPALLALAMRPAASASDKDVMSIMRSNAPSSRARIGLSSLRLLSRAITSNRARS